MRNETNDSNVRISNILMVQQPAIAAAPGRRPWDTQIDDHARNQFGQILHDRICPSAAELASIAGDILRPQALVEDVYQIDNGWGTGRYSVIIEFTERMRGSGTTERVLLTGYTDHDECVSRGGVIDPDTRIYLTGVERVTCQQSGKGIIMDIDGSQIIASPRGSRPSDSKSILHVTRPMDVIGQTTARGLAVGRARSKMSRNASGHGNVVTLPATSMLSLNQASRFDNVNGSTFLADVTKALHSGWMSTASGDLYEPDQEAVEETVASVALGRLREAITNIPMYEVLERETSLNSTGYVAWSDLEAIDGTVTDRTTVQKYDYSGHELDLFSRDPNAATNDNLAAYIIAINSPVQMARNAIIGLRMHATNLTHNGGWRCVVAECIPYSEAFYHIGLEDRVAAIFETQILPMIDTMYPHGVNILIDASSELGMSVTIDNGDPISFPLYCSTLYSPVVTSDDKRAGILGTDIRRTIDSVLSHRVHSASGSVARRGEAAEKEPVTERARPVDSEFTRRVSRDRDSTSARDSFSRRSRENSATDNNRKPRGLI